MALSFKGAKKYPKHNGFSPKAKFKTPLPASIHRYSLTQGENILLRPEVAEGDHVVIGQKLADFDSFDALPIFSSVSGTVLSLSNNIIEIENNMLSERCKITKPEKNYSELTTREKLWLMREGGICEVRTGEPLHALLSPDSIPDCVVVCCFDSDPYISSPQVSCIGNTEKLLRGLDIVLSTLSVKKAAIGIENDAAATFSDLKYHLRYNTDILLYPLKPRYPQSESEILVRTLTGKGTDDIKTVVLSAETLINTAEVFETGIPITHKAVTVSGDDILTPVNYKAPIGMTLEALLSDSGYTAPKVVIQNGVIKGKRVSDTSLPVTGFTSAVIAFNNENNIPKYREEPI